MPTIEIQGGSCRSFKTKTCNRQVTVALASAAVFLLKHIVYIANSKSRVECSVLQVQLHMFKKEAIMGRVRFNVQTGS